MARAGPAEWMAASSSRPDCRRRCPIIRAESTSRPWIRTRVSPSTTAGLRELRNRAPVSKARNSRNKAGISQLMAPRSPTTALPPATPKDPVALIPMPKGHNKVSRDSRTRRRRSLARLRHNRLSRPHRHSSQRPRRLPPRRRRRPR